MWAPRDRIPRFPLAVPNGRQPIAMLLHCVRLHVYPEGVSDRCQGYLQALQGRPAGSSARCRGRSCRIDAPRRIGSAPTRCQAGACRMRLASADLLPLPELLRIRDTMPRRTAAAACCKWMRCRIPAACRIAPRIPSNRQIWRAYTHPAAGSSTQRIRIRAACRTCRRIRGTIGG